MVEERPGGPEVGESATVGLAGQILDLLRSRGETARGRRVADRRPYLRGAHRHRGCVGGGAGGVVAYATDLKAVLLGVPRALLDRYGAVHPAVAAAMAEGVRLRLGASFSVATTGVAGPDPQDGQPVGTVHIAVATEGETVVRTLALPGDRAAVRAGTVAAVLGLLLGRLGGGTDRGVG